MFSLKQIIRKFVFRTLLKKPGLYVGDKVRTVNCRNNRRRTFGVIKKFDRSDNTYLVYWSDSDHDWHSPQFLRLKNQIEFNIIDYVYCENCLKYVCLGKLDTIRDTKHKNHNVRKISEKEYSLLEKNKLKLE